MRITIRLDYRLRLFDIYHNTLMLAGIFCINSPVYCKKNPNSFPDNKLPTYIIEEVWTEGK
ncbi:hypothetical protein HS5_11250 [Acidianus sp. HS-5]|nr:hypothetical protein HS5_11250 [Acidianus sp. HS-5]